MKKNFKKVALIKTDYEEGRLQPTPAGHPKGELLSTGYEQRMLFTMLAPIDLFYFSDFIHFRTAMNVFSFNILVTLIFV
jgi:hypothetical protein